MTSYDVASGICLALRRAGKQQGCNVFYHDADVPDRVLDHHLLHRDPANILRARAQEGVGVVHHGGDVHRGVHGGVSGAGHLDAQLADVLQRDHEPGGHRGHHALLPGDHAGQRLDPGRGGYCGEALDRR